ncbi:MAG TPA: 16S rRNA (adenine(1518)-N(6)/adenine(1519)-N(6))-dimethyltransferase RsmA [Alphaproteobacteria bacterium]|nr:16S rRNA (adenine(1518)-N(6)/adenine(1519)-N(6))-dimethyltransferase RsmA [Alphaproteobacteria bacterium]
MSGADPVAVLPPLRDVIVANDLAAKKALGQNFLLDLNLTGRIARVAGDLSALTVVEVGPGPGGLTRALLLNGARRLVAIERDDRCIAALQPLVAAAEGRLRLLAADALEVDPAELGPAPRCIVANLPYNVATPLLVGWLRQAEAFAHFTLMFQKEVADRITAAPGDKAYGRLGVLAQWLCRADQAFDIPPHAFVPPPKIVSTVVHLVPRRDRDDGVRFETMERVTAAAFGQRRKMLRGSLKSLGRPPEPLLEAAGIEPTARAEEIDVAGFVRLCRAVQDLPA